MKLKTCRPPKNSDYFIGWSRFDGTGDSTIYRTSSGHYWLSEDGAKPKRLSESAAMVAWLENTSPSDRWSDALIKALGQK